MLPHSALPCFYILIYQKELEERGVKSHYVFPNYNNILIYPFAVNRIGKKQKYQAAIASKPGPSQQAKSRSPHHEQGNKQHNKRNKRKRTGDKGEGQGAGVLKMPKTDIGQHKPGGR